MKNLCRGASSRWVEQFFQQFQKEDQFTTALHDTLKQIRAALLREETLDEIIIQRKQALKVKLENHLISSADYEQNEQITKILESCLVETRKKRVNDPQKTSPFSGMP